MKERFGHLYKHTKTYIIAHKKISGAIFIVLLIAGYGIYKSIHAATTPPRYVLSTVEKSTLVVSVSGSGQIESSNQIDIKPKVSGDILSIPVVAGQTIKKGDIIARLDSRDAQRAVRDAQTNLQSAKLSLEKITNPNQSSVLSAQSSLDSAKQTRQSAQDNLSKTYISGFNTIADAMNTIQAGLTTMNDILYVASHSPYFQDVLIRQYAGETAIQYKLQAGVEVDNTRRSYDSVLQDFRAMPRDASPEKIEEMLSKVNDLAVKATIAVKDLYNTVQYVNNNTPVASRSNQLSSDLSALNTTSSNITSTANNLTSTIQNIKDYKNQIKDADVTIQQKTLDLQTTTQGDTLDVRSAQLSVDQRQNALNDARETLAQYTVRAPFNGVVGKVSAKVADSASAGTALATLVTKDQIATITLNEVDVSKVKIGQKATLTFDAVEDLVISGEVIEVDTVGEVNQGVVTYSAKIKLDTTDDRIKSGMSVSANVITDTKTDVLLVPNSAVKTTNGRSVVQVVEGVDEATIAQSTAGITLSTAPRATSVVIGASNDTDTEIVSGLEEGQVIVTRTITGSAATASTQRSGASLFGGGGAVRVGR